MHVEERDEIPFLEFLAIDVGHRTANFREMPDRDVARIEQKQRIAAAELDLLPHADSTVIIDAGPPTPITTVWTLGSAETIRCTCLP